MRWPFTALVIFTLWRAVEDTAVAVQKTIANGHRKEAIRETVMGRCWLKASVDQP